MQDDGQELNINSIMKDYNISLKELNSLKINLNINKVNYCGSINWY